MTSTTVMTEDRKSLHREAGRSARVWIFGEYRSTLEGASLAEFDDVMSASKGRCLRVLADRENWYLRVENVEQPSLGMYLKKHRVRTLSTRVRARLGAEPRTSAGRVEADNTRSLVELGIDAMRPIAYGERLCRDGRLESFLLTEELEGYRELQDFIVRRFAPIATATTAERKELRRLVLQVAEIAARFHAAGFNHRDFYCCHFLVKEVSANRFDIRLIDLQRVQHRRWFRRRWIVKDLAQLASMVPAGWVDCRDKTAFLHRYLGVRKLREGDKRLIRLVIRKQIRIEWRQRRKS